MSHIDPKLKELMIDSLDKHRTKIGDLYVYFQQHNGISADSKNRDYNDFIHKISLSLYVACCQLDMAILDLRSD